MRARASVSRLSLPVRTDVHGGKPTGCRGRSSDRPTLFRLFFPNVPSRPSDIIVIGAGVVGCAIAYELARRGASVEVIDERLVGMGATQASAGILAPYLEAREDNP